MTNVCSNASPVPSPYVPVWGRGQSLVAANTNGEPGTLRSLDSMSVVAFTIVCDSPDCQSMFVRHLCDIGRKTTVFGGN